MHHKLPLEIILCVVEFVKHDKATLLKLLSLSRELHSIVEPCIYEAACFRQEPDIQAAKLQSFSRNVIKNGGALGIHARKFVLTAPSFGRSALIAHILPHLTCLTHFEVSQAWRIPGHVKARIFSAFRTSQLSTFIWEGEDKDEAIQERDLLEFLQSHPSITHLEIPTFTFTSPLPPSVPLPRVKKLVVRSYQHLLNTPALQMASHLGVGVPDDLSVVGMDAEEVFPRVQYFAALGLFDSEDFATLSSHLPNLRGLVYNPDMVSHPS
ncbi:hypothetical protein ONZ45_g11070 [Pleurotus djamor]|nr:hypothetical protein ONZ45_g11070 [Pleurotus djamor]